MVLRHHQTRVYQSDTRRAQQPDRHPPSRPHTHRNQPAKARNHDPRLDKRLSISAGSIAAHSNHSARKRADPSAFISNVVAVATAATSLKSAGDLCRFRALWLFPARKPSQPARRSWPRDAALRRRDAAAGGRPLPRRSSVGRRRCLTTYEGRRRRRRPSRTSLAAQAGVGLLAAGGTTPGTHPDGVSGGLR